MVEKISNNTIKVLLIVTIVISVISITLSMIAVSKTVTSVGVQENQVPADTTGQVKLDVPPEPSEEGSQVVLQVVPESS